MALRFQHKLIIPTAAYQLVERTSLLERLDQTITTKQVVVLAALAGWGKTTALAQWAAHTTLPTAWYTLDNTDRDPNLFLDYLLHAVARFVPGAESLSRQLATVSPQELPDLCRATALAIAGAPEPFALVLDDFHTLEDDSIAVLPRMELIFDLLATVAEYAPNCHLILASRMLPNLRGIARLMAQRRAVFFDYTVLQWTVSEVQQLATISSGSAIPNRRAERLVAHMSGWVTGIVLALDQGIRAYEQMAVDSVADFRQVYAFFAEQIIAPLTPSLQRFLEDTSVLEDLSPQRCNALREGHDAAAYLEHIIRRGLFVSHHGGALTYHSLFRDFLRARLAQDPVRERALLLRAGDLYRGEEDVERALDCYLAASAEDRAIAMLRKAIPRFRQRSRHNTMLACFERLSAYSERSGNDRLLPADLLLAQVRVYSDLALWERAELTIQLAGMAGDAAIRWEAAILQADLLLLQGNRARAEAVLAEVPSASLPPWLLFEYHRTNGRVQILAGDVRAAIEALEMAYAIAPAALDSADVPSQLATIADNLGWAYFAQGDRQEALRQFKRADACWQASGNSARRAATLNNLGMVMQEEGRYAEARAAFASGLEAAEQTLQRRIETYVHLSLADLDLLEGHVDEALGHFARAHNLAMQLDITTCIAAAAVGGLWATALAADAAGAQSWRAIAAGVDLLNHPDLRGRIALSRCLLLTQHPHPDGDALLPLIDEASAVEKHLLLPERAYLALLRAALVFAAKGWPAAAPAWAAFETVGARLPDTLLMRFVPPHQGLFSAATAKSSFAQRLLEARQSAQHWQIAALGPFTCLRDGIPCELAPLQQTILVRLLDAGPQGLTVEHLWEDVWGDSDLRMTALHKAVARLREQTGLAVAARSGSCAIHSPWPAIDYDVRAFEEALAGPPTRESLVRAKNLYGGDFLLNAPLSAALWVERRRSQLEQRYLDLLEQLARLYERDEPKMAIQYYQRILQIDGCREETAMRLMRLAARLRNHALVNATFEQLVGALNTLGVTPEPATTDFYRQLH